MAVSSVQNVLDHFAGCLDPDLIVNKAALCGVLVAGTVAVLGGGLPYKLGLLAAVVVGMLTAMVVEETLGKVKGQP